MSFTRCRLTQIGTVVTALTVLAGCRHEIQPDAYGNIEAEAVVVGAQTSGQLLQFVPEEGVRLLAGDQVAVVDTGPLVLQRQQITAQKATGNSKQAEVGQQIDVLEVQRQVAERSYDRIKRLYAEQGATAQQLDNAEREYKTLVAQIEATRVQRQTAGHDVVSTDARLAQVEDQIHRSRVINPRTGTVLATYVRTGEMVQTGQALYRIAGLDTLDLRAYITEPQLSSVKVGATAQITIDAPGGTRQQLNGVVSWVASEAQFTPTPIQTRAERANLVYAVKIRVPNPGGVLKIGMPADVQFGAPVATK